MHSVGRVVGLATAPQVLRMYRSILRQGRNWPNKIDGEFIKAEARELFHRNKSLTEPADIERKIGEAEARVALALHYRNPHPRPVYAPPGNTPEQMRAQGTSFFPQYMDSIVNPNNKPPW